ncbi:MAG: hypothetical protein Kow00121_18570 [Elainellaceae cyanobacterium]
MPPRWPRQPTRQDPSYRKLDDRMNFALHVAIFAAINSGIWFVRTLQAASWSWTGWVTGTWALALVTHAVFIFAIADYSDASAPSSSQKS